MEKYIQLYLEAALPKFPMEGIVGVCNHLNSEKVIANVSLHLGTKDIILADVSNWYSYNLKYTIINTSGHVMLVKWEFKLSVSSTSLKV